MYLHLGGDTVISTEDLIGIFDIENTTIGKATRDFLSRSEREKRVQNVSYELPRSFSLCSKRENPVNYRVYISQISPRTLTNRAMVRGIVGSL
ncbi:MAG TPA: DUF370 domain-containing protein [Candidatus Onthovicinus excrementipullorum]|nr:DUF370 domain-containing protein [Candidatus Onthovicinus excrementipullorum]